MADGNIIYVYDSDDSIPECHARRKSSRIAGQLRSASKNSTITIEENVMLDAGIASRKRTTQPDNSSTPPTKKPKENAEPTEWCCSVCTFRNDPARGECEMCLTERPGGPPLLDELVRLQTTCTIASSTAAIECPVCFATMAPGEGAVLSECLHAFCRECLVQTVIHCNVSDVRCPYIDAVYSCTSSLLVSEIRALLSDAQYDQYLSRSLREAEQTAPNAFHCKTPNCHGWWLCENDQAMSFVCPVCCVSNCIQCKAIHTLQTCDGYKQSKVLAKDEQGLKKMIETGDIMKCPTCQALVTKISGCDFLVCSSCRTMICWVTRGLRWGPRGVGDTSAGCRCNLNGRRCHPKCRNCH